ncbi:MAG: DUF3429 domain-containing protein [Thiomicrorhabdus chilensis]|uniref:DUF3429 domain-containing protein n=1 Tax=Thiomicrorhabdus chilensis TaxID=63656 RepID=UPI00299F3593|nr:DUF3429 domain-containing protein [Thiomicrorhabdus chilensis]MDX1347593.1 DUF3429 domain-containing protein [Thiomicrorhabdus chilensis]
MLYKILGYAGLIPFLALAGLSHVALFEWEAQLVLLSYAAMIFSFLGGVLWGASVISVRDEEPSMGVLWISVVSMLWAWGWLLGAFWWPEFNFLWLASVSFLLLWFYETHAMAKTFPFFFVRLRRDLSWVAALSLFIGGWA